MAGATKTTGLVVELPKNAFEALRRECRDQMDAAIGDLGKAARGEVDPEREKLNACADVLSAIQHAQAGWALEDPREEAMVKAVELSAEGVAFLLKQREAAAAHVRELDISGEGDLEYNAREVFLVHVLDRVLSEGVAA